MPVVRLPVILTCSSLAEYVNQAQEYNGPHVKTSNEDLMVNIRS